MRSLGMEICKIYSCATGKKDLVLTCCSCPAASPYRTKELSAQIGSARLSFASEEYMEQFLDLTPAPSLSWGL